MTAAWDRDEALRVAAGLEAKTTLENSTVTYGPPAIQINAAALLRSADAEITRLRAREEAAEKMAEALSIAWGFVPECEGGDRCAAALAAWDATLAQHPAPDPDRAFWRDYYTRAKRPT